ncbi:MULTISPECIES: hypothetical protein [unclassified Halanaerobium]|nr:MULTISPECIES: hypothetical protein [unclassified Halanaerobium]
MAFINQGKLLAMAIGSPKKFEKELSKSRDEEVTLLEVFKELNQ